jgi:pentatricopeptide repeat protein
MKREDIQPGLIVYTCLIQSCIKAKDIIKAEQLFDEMRN